MKPVIAQKKPYAIDLTEGKTIYWCACGKSKNQPFCDGSHAGSEFTPTAFTPVRTGKHHFCGCKHTKNKPMCDGTHNDL